MAETLVGKVVHYYDKIGVAVIKVLKHLKVGQEIKISGHDQEFVQTISSLQIEHQSVEEVEKGQVVGMKVEKPVKENDEVFLVE